MPNTLGLTTSTDASAERLLKGLLNEDTLPFQAQAPEFQLFDGLENEGTGDGHTTLHAAPTQPDLHRDHTAKSLLVAIRHR